MQHVPESLWGVRPKLQCQYCSSAAERNSPARSPGSVFGVMQDTAVAVQNNTTRAMAAYGVDDGECFSQPPDLAAGRPRPEPSC